jgi:LmbE family N-acetylglucosaminyl deacetylase
MVRTKNVLVVAPHQDDEVIGCGGTMAMLIEKGYNVFVVHVFKGSSGVVKKTAVQAHIIRQREAVQASKSLNFKLLRNLGFEDRKETAITDVQNSLISIIRNVGPSVVFTPHANEQDFEHRIVNQATKDACWLAATENFKGLGMKAPKISAVFGYEVWTPIQKPNFYLDISKYILKKQRALKKFTSQVKGTSWLKGAIGLNAYRGTTLIGENYAEAFEANPSDLLLFIDALKDLMN